MTTNSMNLNSSVPFSGLGTLTFNVLVDGNYQVEVQSTIPNLLGGSAYDSSSTVGGSGLSIVVNNNGSPLYTMSAPTPSQKAMGGSIRFHCVATDVITVVFSSSDDDDYKKNYNAVQSVVNLFQKQVG